MGDAEHDHAVLRRCECAVAVAHALPMVRHGAALVTQGVHGAGVRELIARLLASDVAAREPHLTHHHLLLGTREDGPEVRLSPHGGLILLAGTSGSGKSTLAPGVLERLMEARSQCCLLDPEGDDDPFEGAVVLGDRQRAPTGAEALRRLEPPDQHVVVNLLGWPLHNRPGFFTPFLAHLHELRVHTGRPHWLVADEAHHRLPAAWPPAGSALTAPLAGLLLITVHPNPIAPAALAAVAVIIAVGGAPERTIASFCEALGQSPPTPTPVILEPGEALVWPRRMPPTPFACGAPRDGPNAVVTSARTLRATSEWTRACMSEARRAPSTSGPKPCTSSDRAPMGSTMRPGSLICAGETIPAGFAKP